MQQGYWTSKAGLRHQQRWRDRRRLLGFVDQEPEQKGPRGARSAADFRQQFRAKSVSGAKGYWPRACLALDLHFKTARRQPPNIENLAKHYLDLLGPDDKNGGSPVLFKDDGQVKMLYVSCRHAWAPDEDEQPSITLSAAPRTDAIARLEAAHGLAMGRFGFEPDTDEPDHHDLDIGSRLRDAREFEASDDPRLRKVGATVRFQARREFQEHFLQAGDSWLSNLFQRHARELMMGKPAARGARTSGTDGSVPGLRQSYEPFDPNTLGDGPEGLFLVPLPPLPTRSGGGNRFKEAVEDACRAFVNAHPALSPLVAPLRVTILVVPPHQKDLDNLALDVVPTINRHFRPPLDPWLLEATDVGLPAGFPARDPQERDRDRARLRSIGQHSVWAYQVIQLQRQPQHRKEGWMAVVLGHGQNRYSLWREADNYVTAALDCD